MKETLTKRTLLTYVAFILSLYVCSDASEVFRVPLPDGGEMLSEGKRRMVTVRYNTVTPAEIAAFYTREFAGMADIKWNETGNSREILIYDWGNRPWHRINVYSRGMGKETIITIKKDSWTWIIGTLVIRFIGVFIVLLALMIALLISGSIFSFKKVEPGKTSE